MLNGPMHSKHREGPQAPLLAWAVRLLWLLGGVEDGGFHPDESRDTGPLPSLLLASIVAARCRRRRSSHAAPTSVTAVQLGCAAA